MYYTSKERLDIVNKVYTHYMTKEEAAREYQISKYVVINYTQGNLMYFC